MPAGGRLRAPAWLVGQAHTGQSHHSDPWHFRTGLYGSIMQPTGPIPCGMGSVHGKGVAGPLPATPRPANVNDRQEPETHKGAELKNLDLLRRATPPTPGTYICTVPGCKVKQHDDGYCPSHGVPLRLTKVH